MSLDMVPSWKLNPSTKKSQICIPCSRTRKCSQRCANDTFAKRFLQLFNLQGPAAQLRIFPLTHQLCDPFIHLFACMGEVVSRSEAKLKFHITRSGACSVDFDFRCIEQIAIAWESLALRGPKEIKLSHDQQRVQVWLDFFFRGMVQFLKPEEM